MIFQDTQLNEIRILLHNISSFINMHLLIFNILISVI